MQENSPKTHQIPCHATKWIILISFFSVTALFFWSWQQLHRDGQMARFAMVSDYVISSRLESMDKSRREKLRRILANADLTVVSKDSIAALLKIQSWIGNQITQVDIPSASNTSKELLPLIQTDKVFSCGGMASMLEELLLAQDITVRRVQLYRSNFEPNDTHVLLEAQLPNGRWIALDPTFNLTFQDSKGITLGIEEIRARLASNDHREVKPVYHGERLYPANIQKYYIDWRQLFANAYVDDYCPDCSRLNRLPPFRYWSGPVRYGYGEKLGRLATQHNLLYFTTVVIYPLILICLGLVALWLIYRYRVH